MTPQYPQQDGMIERVIHVLKEQGVHRHCLDTCRHASGVIAGWIQFYRHRRPHQAPQMKTLAEAFALAAYPVQVSLGQSIHLHDGQVARIHHRRDMRHECVDGDPGLAAQMAHLRPYRMDFLRADTIILQDGNQFAALYVSGQ